MSGILKGDSIYKSGGSGGGYKDGGSLVDAEYIKVENNTVSTYDNTSRDEIKFYLEPKAGEIVNSVIELTTAVNALISVYVYNSVTGIYTPLYYNINTVSAGDTYNITINGNNFYISDPITPPPNEYLEEVDGVLYRCVKIGTVSFMAENYRGNISGTDKYIYGGVCYYTPRNVGKWTFPKNWRLINSYDWNYMLNYLGVSGTNGAPLFKSKNTAYPTWNSRATNSTGASITPDGWYNISAGTAVQKGVYCRFIGITTSFPLDPVINEFKDDLNDIGGASAVSNIAYSLRLIKDS